MYSKFKFKFKIVKNKRKQERKIENKKKGGNLTGPSYPISARLRKSRAWPDRLPGAQHTDVQTLLPSWDRPYACSGPPGCDILSRAPWYVDHGSQSRRQRIPRMAERARGGWPWRKSSARRLTTSGDKTLVALASFHVVALRSPQLTQKEKQSRAAIAIYRCHRRLRFPSPLVLLSGVRWSRITLCAVSG